MKISIITINYNNKFGFKKTIDSILCQTDQNFEFIIIDGDSTDGSKDLFREVTIKRKIIVSEPDNGIFNAMNKGVKLAHGEYILFLNSGDSLADKSVIQNINNSELLDQSIDVVTGDTICEKNGKFDHLWPAPDFVTINTFYSGSLCHQSTFIHRQLLIKYPYIESNRFCSDRQHLLNIFINGATYKAYHSNISRFDCSGISSSKNNEQEKQREVRKNIEETLPLVFLSDYDLYVGQRTELEKWIISKRNNIIIKILSSLIRVSTKVSTTISNILKK